MLHFVINQNCFNFVIRVKLIFFTSSLSYSQKNYCIEQNILDWVTYRTRAITGHSQLQANPHRNHAIKQFFCFLCDNFIAIIFWDQQATSMVCSGTITVLSILQWNIGIS